MTREEAIEILKFQRGYFCDLKGCEELQAFTMAIKALEQKPCDNLKAVKSIINREINLLEERMSSATSEGRWVEEEKYKCAIEHLESINECIKALPPVILKQKAGKWIKHNTGHSIYYDCSLCGCAAPCTETADKILWKMANYCPDCGAKMEGESE